MALKWSKFQVMETMKRELAKSNLSEEEILQKTMTLMKAFCKDDQGQSI